MFRYGNIVNDFTVLNLLYMYNVCIPVCKRDFVF